MKRITLAQKSDKFKAALLSIAVHVAIIAAVVVGFRVSTPSAPPVDKIIQAKAIDLKQVETPKPEAPKENEQEKQRAAELEQKKRVEVEEKKRQETAKQAELKHQAVLKQKQEEERKRKEAVEKKGNRKSKRINCP